MAQMDISEFQQLVYQELQAQTRSAECLALTMFAFDGLLVGVLSLNTIASTVQVMGLAISSARVCAAAIVALLLAALCATLTLWARQRPLLYGHAGVSAHDAYLQVIRHFTDDAVAEEVAHRVVIQQRVLQGKRLGAHAALLLTLIGLLGLGLSMLLS
jgi:hypothetical protein